MSDSFDGARAAEVKLLLSIKNISWLQVAVIHNGWFYSREAAEVQRWRVYWNKSTLIKPVR